MSAGKLPKLSGPEACKLFCNKDGFTKVSHKKHAKLKKELEDGTVLVAIVPMHGNKDLSDKILKSIYESAGHTRESFLELLGK